MDTSSSTLAFVAIFFLLNFQSEALTIKDCPSDCICYQDYLYNLASWKWVGGGAEPSQDEDHPQFNPYLDHNEVYDNPLTTWMRSNNSEEKLKTVTCIIRSDVPSTLATTLKQLPADVQVLSILQAPGSGNLTITKEIMTKFNSLIGLELQGVTNQEGHLGVFVFRLGANALEGQDKLVYLNLDQVLIEQAPVKSRVQEDVFVKVRPIGEDDMANDVQPRLLYLGIREKNDDNKILPYNEYKKEKVELHEIPLSKSIVGKQGDPKISVAFTQLSKLVHLRISGCNMLDISWDMFYKLRSLKYLFLDNNDLLFLPDFVFYATPNLTALSLAGNRILNLQTVGLAGLLHLEKLDVTHNNITHLSELSLPPFPHLKVADFRFNPIETIFPNTFEVMNSTEALYLGNPATTLEFFANSFYGLVSLTTLDIRNVRIGALEGQMLKGMPKLRSLTMDGAIRRISYDAFTEVPNLETINLSKCGLVKISMDTFYGLGALQELNLSHNKLEALPPGVFDDQPSLRELYLQHNKLTTLPTNIFHHVPAQLVRLEGNPWHCSCNMVHWDPKVTNVVKRYYVPTNNTYCQPKYDKRSMCTQQIPSLAVKYVFEKRVSPICRTPLKVQNKSVFQAQRKVLHDCEPVKKVRKPGKLIANATRTAYSKNSTLSHITKTIKKVLPTNIRPTKDTATPSTISPATSTTSQRIAITTQSQNSDEFPNEINSRSLNLTGATEMLKRQALSYRSKSFPSRAKNGGNGLNAIPGNSMISKKSLKLAKLQKSLKRQQF